MNKLLVVFNSSEFTYQHRNVDWYKYAIRTILSQKFDGFHVVYSGFCNTPETKEKIQKEFGDQISYSYFDESPLPVNISYDISAQKCNQTHGEYEAVIYCDSGIALNQDNVLEEMYREFKTNKYGLIAINTTSDNGFSFWQLNINNNRTILPIGKTVNWHFQLHDTEIYRKFGHYGPTRWSSYCSESVFGTLCYSINKHFLVMGDIIAVHHHSLDFGSGSVEEERKDLLNKENRSWSHLFRSKKTIDEIINDPEAKACGFFYEVVQNVLLPNMDCYENGLCKDPERLAKFVQENCFLSKDELDYSTVQNIFIP